MRVAPVYHSKVGSAFGAALGKAGPPMPEDKPQPASALSRTGEAIRIAPLGPVTGGVTFVPSLSEAQQRELTESYVRDQMELEKRAKGSAIDAQLFEAKLTTMTRTATAASHSGLAVTLQDVHEGMGGRAEAVMGNTDQARSGRLSRSMAGGVPTLQMILGAIVVIVLVSLFLRH